MKINYGISRKCPSNNRRIQTQNGTLEIEGSWDSDETHIRIKEAILKDNPGCIIVGYMVDKSEEVQ